MALDVKRVGCNLVFGPVVDIDQKPPCVVIGGLERSFGTNVTTVVKYATSMITGMHEVGILTSLKHFPGHGSAMGDTHLGMVDVTQTWTHTELEPYKRLIDMGIVDMVMTSHIINNNLDNQVPATLSRRM
ncbi:glycoside hydrolase family 3 protein [Rickettsiales endosymbiont of Peranema trichophorum]|uniref:glycoside hydrolase family 3 N-terminal domain-containing protein n=1 Tax=Rickettsiales endosymbiont of Peranema trichophorum TaxID=2486577 RepID=UPI00102352F0|nr:glycoside hydrolase family 3 N-terminal domain-containing protein [Rickettsiales endosymbiont of Peranema trichophorum]RZI47567.1 glycoside hydrolase family 3 protein [Rickettsiales endosymbiont of Peranema trichophorum]